MNIVIFNKLTTSEELAELQVEAEKYTGLYVDMHKPEQRKYVKDKAAHIGQLLKKVDRHRIDASAEYKRAVEKEAASLSESLKIANLPFTLLIDEYTAERKKVLDAEKARKAAIDLANQIESDHEIALLMNDKFDSDIAENKRLQAAHEESIRKQAADDAKRLASEEIARQKAAAEQAEKQRAEDKELAQQAMIFAEQKAKQDAIDAETRRLADIESAKQAEIARQKAQQEAERLEAEAREADEKHQAGIHNAILKVLLDNGITEGDAKTVINLAAKRQLPNLQINY